MQNQDLKPKTLWHHAPELFTICSEASNIGIVINMISKWIPEILKVGHGFLGGISHYADVLIYVFKAFIRITKLIGRFFFNIHFDDENQLHYQHKIFCDALTLVNFSLAILSFTAVIASGAVAITLGWTFGLIGIGIVGYSDYYLSKKQAELELSELYRNYLDGDSQDILELFTKLEDKNNKNYEFKLYVGLIIGLTFLLVFGSSALFLPTSIAATFTIISKVASIYLAGIAIFRFSNWIKSKLDNRALENNNIQNSFEQFQNQHQNTPRAQLLMDFAKTKNRTFFAPFVAPIGLSAPQLAL